MPWFALKQRSTTLERLDAPDIPLADLWQNLDELAIINRYLGGHAVTLAGLNQLVLNRHKFWRIADIGCGGGDTLQAVYHWAKRHGINVQLTGVDLKVDCLDYARKACDGLPIEWIAADYRDITQSYDIVLTSLFCHHLSDAELRDFLQWSKQHVQVGLLINDLQRHPLAWWGIKLLTQAFSRSVLVRHDAPLSVWRGFSQRELKNLLVETGWSAEIKWCWAFRYLVLGYV